MEAISKKNTAGTLLCLHKIIVPFMPQSRIKFKRQVGLAPQRGFFAVLTFLITACNCRHGIEADFVAVVHFCCELSKKSFIM